MKQRAIKGNSIVIGNVTKSKHTKKEALETKNGYSLADQFSWGAFNTQKGRTNPSRTSFETLRSMAKANNLVQNCITHIKHTLTKSEWFFRPVDRKADPKQYKQQIDFLTNLFKYPNSMDSDKDLISKLVDDILIIDRGIVEKVRNAKGDIIELYAIDGADIKPNINEYGMFDDPAYYQFLNSGSNFSGDGKPDAEFEYSDLMVMMVNPQVQNGRIGYGVSPVESVLQTIVASLQASILNASYFSSNKVPPYIASIPGVSKEDLTNLKTAFESSMQTGEWPTVWVNTPNLEIKPLRPTNAEMQFYELGLWLARIIISAFELSPQDFGLTMDINKASSEAQERMEQGAHNVADCIANKINRDIIADMAERDPKYKDLEFAFDTINKVDELAQAQIDQIQYQIHTRLPNEMRSRDGLDPIQGGDEFAPAPMQGAFGNAPSGPSDTTGLGGKSVKEEIKTIKSIRDKWSHLLK